MGESVTLRTRFRGTAAAAALLLLLEVATAEAKDELKFLAGVSVGFVSHETGHLAMGAALDAQPGFKRIEFAGIPFFAIDHESGLPPRQEYAISAGGFLVQHATSEWILTRHPELRSERAPFAKGMLVFGTFMSTLYAGAAFTHRGPPERDPRGMAVTRGVDEAWVGALILAPAALDTYRYFRPHARWAKWVSRAFKLGLVLLVLK